MPDQPSTPATDAVQALSNFLSEPASATPTREEIQAELRKASVNVPRLKRRIENLVAKAKGQHRLESARSKRMDMLARLKKLVPLQPINQTKEQLHQFLQEAFGNDPQMAVLFRKFEDSSEADLNSLIEDIALLDDTDDGLPEQ